MAKRKNQLSLPGFKEEKVSRFPQPHVRKFRDIKKYELLYRPFDLKFRGRINKWLVHIKQKSVLHIEKILEEIELKIVNLYLFPQAPSNKWLSQEEVAERIKGIKKRKIRNILVNSLISIWSKLPRG